MRPEALSHKNLLIIQFLLPIVFGYVLLDRFVRGGSFGAIFSNWEEIVATGLVGLVVVFFQDLIPKPVKEILVFWKVKHRLPGHHAYSDSKFQNTQIPADTLKRIQAKENLPAEEQNAEWYRAYQSCQDEGAVKNYSYRYLAWRESAVLAFALAPISIFSHFVRADPNFVGSAIMCAICIAAYLLFAVVARMSSKALIEHVLIRS